MCIAIWGFMSVLSSTSVCSIPTCLGLMDTPCRSSTLDSWQLKHLRTMKVGGNRSATEFYTRHGSAALLSDTDTKKKYIGRIADLYKEELLRRVQHDTDLYVWCYGLCRFVVSAKFVTFESFPAGLLVEGADVPSVSVVGTGDEDDFFSNWDQPAKTAGSRNTETGSQPVSSITASAAVQLNPRTVTSTALKSMSSSAAGTKLVANASLWSGGKVPVRPGTPGSATGGTRSTKLGAKKASAGINYEEAERKARADEDRIHQSSNHTLRDTEAQNHHACALPVASVATAATSLAPADSAAPRLETGKYESGQDPERLGIGFKRLSLGSANATLDAPSHRLATSGDAPTTARERFGNQKAISSEMFFERGAYDPAAVSEAKLKLAQFQGATSISSNQYFGREEECEEGVGVSGSFTGNESLSALEASTRDALSRVMAKEEVQNVMESIRAGALKVCRCWLGSLAG